MRLRLAVAACMLCASFAARADVTASTTGSDTFSGTFDSPTDTTVTYNLGTFTGSTGGTVPGLFTYQITNSQVILTDVDAVGILYTPFTGFEFTDLSGDPNFSSLMLDGASTITGGIASFTDDSLTINLAGIDVFPGQSAIYDLTTGDPSSVTPEPASIALFATGLMGVAGVVRRRVVS